MNAGKTSQASYDLVLIKQFTLPDGRPVAQRKSVNVVYNTNLYKGMDDPSHTVIARWACTQVGLPARSIIDEIFPVSQDKTYTWWNILCQSRKYLQQVLKFSLVPKKMNEFIYIKLG